MVLWSEPQSNGLKRIVSDASQSLMCRLWYVAEVCASHWLTAGALQLLFWCSREEAPPNSSVEALGRAITVHTTAAGHQCENAVCVCALHSGGLWATAK